ncbi:MAG: 6-phosphogluconolactonase [Candidatus Hydrogenedentes bacterium]|nr:6-phosphogluconolactonase [Candidatus Hydrogenedentota bacterium]
MSIAVTTFDSKTALLAALDVSLREALTTSHADRFAAIISGGSTPLPVYNAIAENPPAIAPGAGLAFADDRHVPMDSPESNYGNARPMIEALRIPEDRLLRIHPELSLEAAADRYNDDWAAFFAAGGVIPVAYLGLGADGHTCSLFNDADLARCEGRFAAPVYKDSPPHRVTIGPDVLARVDEVVFVVAGNDKIEMIETLLNNPGAIPAGKATAGCRSVALWRA